MFNVVLTQCSSYNQFVAAKEQCSMSVKDYKVRLVQVLPSSVVEISSEVIKTQKKLQVNNNYHLAKEKDILKQLAEVLNEFKDKNNLKTQEELKKLL